MTNLKDIAATLAILGSGALVVSGCDKDQPSTEVPAGDAAPPADTMGEEGMGEEGMGEAMCGGADHTDEGHCAAEGEEGMEEEGAEEEPAEEEAAEEGM